MWWYDPSYGFLLCLRILWRINGVWLMSDNVISGYLGIADLRVERTVELAVDIDVDVDSDGRVVAVETYGRLPDATVLVEVLRAVRVPKHFKSKS